MGAGTEPQVMVVERELNRAKGRDAHATSFSDFELSRLTLSVLHYADEH